MSTRKVLLVDDSKSARYALRVLLEKHGCEVDAVESAEAALEKVRTQLPDAIFMDHLMPGLNGFEALDILKGDSRTAHIPVVMCTSNDDPPYQAQAREKGALGILPKPANAERLMAVLQTIDAARQAPAAASKPTATSAQEMRPAPTAAPVAAIPAADALAEQLRTQLRRTLDADLPALLQAALEPRVERVKKELTDLLLQNIQQDLARARQLATPAAPSGISDNRLEEVVRQLRSEMVRRETEQAQAIGDKLARDVLPNIARQIIGEMERQLNARLEARIGELGERLAEDLPRRPQMVRRITELADSVAEKRVSQWAKTATQDANTATQATATVTSGQLYLMTALAAGMGIASSIAVLFMR